MSTDLQQLKSMPGYFYRQKKNGSIYWNVRLPNETKPKRRRIVDSNGKGVSNQRIAKQIVQLMWSEAQSKVGKEEYTVSDLMELYSKDADERFEGVSNRNKDIRRCLDSLRLFDINGRPFSTLSIEKFTSPVFHTYIAQMIKSKRWSYKSLMDRISTVKRMFAFGVTRGLVSEERAFAIKNTESIKHRRDVKKPKKITAIDIAWLNVLLPYLPSQVTKDMAMFQYLQALRSEELCCLKPEDVDASEDIWVWQPEIYKGQHTHDYDKRVVYISKPAQEVIEKYMDREPDQYCFSPKESDAQKRARMSENRKTPLSCGNKPGSNIKKKPKKKPGNKYTKDSWYKTFRRAIDKARKKHSDMPYFTPHGLRHTGATEIVKLGTLKQVMKFLGHKDIKTTLKYAEIANQEALDLAKKLSEPASSDALNNKHK